MIRPSAPITNVVSVEFWTSERKRSSLTRIDVSASSFCSIVAPAIRMTKTSTNAPMSPRASLLPTDRNDGAQPCQMATWPTAMPRRLHSAVRRHVRDPSCETFSSATKANAPVSTGPHPLR